MQHRRSTVAGDSDRAGADLLRQSPPTSNALGDGWTPGGARRLALYTGIAMVVLFGWTMLLLSSTRSIEVTLVRRAETLAEHERAERSCLAERDRLAAERDNMKEKLKQTRREKNAEAMTMKRNDRACHLSLHDIDEARRPTIDFEIAGLEAVYAGTNNTLIRQHQLVEALAKVQDKAPYTVWRRNLSLSDLRNSLVVELANVLSADVAVLQSLHTLELIQQVREL